MEAGAYYLALKSDECLGLALQRSLIQDFSFGNEKSHLDTFAEVGRCSPSISI